MTDLTGLGECSLRSSGRFERFERLELLERFGPRPALVYRTPEIAIVPETTQTAPRTVRNVKLSMPRRKSLVPTRIHKGLVATMGETIITCPTLNAIITSRIPNVSKTPAIKNQPIDCRFQIGCSPSVGKTT